MEDTEILENKDELDAEIVVENEKNSIEEVEEKEETIIDENVDNLENIEEKKIEDYFYVEENSLNSLSEIFGESESQIIKEYKNFKKEKLFKKFDYLICDKTFGEEEFVKELELAESYGFKSVTVLPTAVSLAKAKTTKLIVRALVSFPYGEDYYKTKLYALKKAVKGGADAIAVTLSTGEIKAGNQRSLAKQIKQYVKYARKKPVTIIIDVKNLSAVELENTILTIINEGGTYSLLPSTNSQDVKPVVSTIKDVVKAVNGKCYVDSGLDIDSAKDIIEILSAGAYFITSTKCPIIAKEIQEKINA